MSDELKHIGYEELRKEEQRIHNEFRDRYCRRSYSQVFYAPVRTDWKVDGLFEDSFYRSARILLQAVLDGKLLEAEGIAAVFLCRHYLELALKYIVFHSRWLKNESTNALNRDIEAVAKGHDLRELWLAVNEELKSRVPCIWKTGLDIDFVGHFVGEFHQIDGRNWHFRYPTQRIVVGSRPTRVSPLGIDFKALCEDLEHAYGVLSGLDSYLVETHGQNDEWESILKGL